MSVSGAGKRGDPGRKELADDVFGRLQAAVEEYRATNRLEGVRENRLPPEATGLELAGAELQLVAQADGGSHVGEGLGTYDARSQTAQVAFGGVGKAR